MESINLDTNWLWASMFWGAIGAGYLVYGWRQKAAIPLAGGVVISLACFLSALPMSLVALATIALVWWLTKQGY